MFGIKSPIRRGAFIVLEGCDRSGKSTQSRKLLEALRSKGIPVKHMAFPARESNIGRVINSYLMNKQNLSDECIHLLFSANRWEYKKEMQNLLEAGVTLVVDRYSFSGVAYSAAKGLDYNWCLSPEKGLVQPDAVFYLKASIDALTNRGNFGEERYERAEFQQEVTKVFNNICEENINYWYEIDANVPEDDVSAQIVEKTLRILDKVQNAPLEVLNF